MYGFQTVVFQGHQTASKAFHTLEDYPTPCDWIDDVAVVSRSKHSRIRVHSTWAQDDTAVGAATGFGALTGGLIGLLLGPGGALAGAIGGGSISFLFGKVADIALKDPALDDFAEALTNDTSALIPVGDKATLDDFGSAVEPFGGEVIYTDLNENDVKAIRKALKMAGEPARTA